MKFLKKSMMVLVLIPGLLGIILVNPYLALADSKWVTIYERSCSPGSHRVDVNRNVNSNIVISDDFSVVYKESNWNLPVRVTRQYSGSTFTDDIPTNQTAYGASYTTYVKVEIYAGGRIDNIRFSKNIYEAGEYITVYIDITNDSQYPMLYLMVLNLIGPDGVTYYNSHTDGNEDHSQSDGCILVNASVNQSKTVTFYVNLPQNAPGGIYHAFASIRSHPWALIEYQGLSWCPPEATFSFIGPQKMNVPYYSQYDAQWCPAASLSMLMKYYNVERKVWEIARDWGWEKSVGLSSLWEWIFSYIQNYGASFGLTIERGGPFWINVDSFVDYITEKMSFGKPVMVCSTFNNENIGGGHCIVLTGWDSNYVYINDPSGAFLQSIPLDTGSIDKLIGRGVLWYDFISKFDSPNSVYAYNVSSSINNHKEKSILPDYTFEQKFRNESKSSPPAVPLMFLDLDGKTHPYGYFWVDASLNDYFPYDSELDNKVTTSEDFSWSAYITNPSKKQSDLKVSIKIVNLGNNQNYYANEFSKSINENLLISP